jgi:hypothetical protein
VLVLLRRGFERDGWGLGGESLLHPASLQQFKRAFKA